MDTKISSIDLDLLNFKQITGFNQRVATPSHSVPSLPKIGKMHQYEIHITTRVFFWLSSSADRQQQVFSLKAERRRITSWLSSWQVASFFLSVKKGRRDMSLFLYLSIHLSHCQFLQGSHWHQRAKKRMRTTIMMVTSTPIAHHCLRPEEHTDL